MDFLNKLEELLKTNKNFVDNRNELIKIKVIEVARNINNENHRELLKLLLNNEEMKKEFFYNIDDITIFNKEHFVNYLKNKQFLSDSYTEFEQSIGFNIKEQMDNNVVLNFPYKDCILEGGQSTEDDKKNEIFFNEILAKDEISRLLEPKVLTNFEKWTIDGKQEFTGFTRDKEKNKARNLPENTITDNLMIKGNNLLALHTLQEEFRGKVKLIYIDPPYNTGNDGFKYNDSFNHSTWLTFMKNRLEIARELLRDDGVIFVQCDDNEQAYLKVLMDEIMGRENCDCIVWQKMDARYDRNTNAKVINRYKEIHEYILIGYKKNKKTYFFNKIKKLPDWNKEAKNPDNDKRGGYEAGIISYEEGHENEDKKSELYYSITLPSGRIMTRHFFVIKEEFEKLRADNRIYFPKDGDGVPRLKVFQNEEQEYKLDSILRGFGTTSTAKDEILNLFGNRDLFQTPKTEKLLMELIRLITQPNDIVLDFFAGSGTTAAVAHKMNRQWITIEQMDYIENITKERLKKVIGNKIKKDGNLLEEIKFDNGGISKNVNWQGGGEFVYFELAKYNQNFVELLEKAETKEDVVDIFNSICEKGFPKYNIDIKKLNENLEEFKKLDLDRMKQDVYNILNKNMLYVPKSLMKDSKYNISETDIELNKSFYSKGI